MQPIDRFQRFYIKQPDGNSFMSKQHEITIRIEKPCHANWNNMDPTEKGRHCNQCAKQVFDATYLSPEEIFKLMKEQKGKACLRMRTDMVDTALPLASKHWYEPISRYFKQVALFAGLQFLFLNQVKAQVKAVLTGNKDSDGTVKKYLKSVEIQGNLKESRTREAISDVHIIALKNNKFLGACFSDDSGHYQLNLKDSLENNEPIKLVFRSLTSMSFEIDSFVINKSKITIDTIYLVPSIALREVEIKPATGTITITTGISIMDMRPKKPSTPEKKLSLDILRNMPDPNPRPSRLDLSGEGYIIK
jgi:hypothetical protein